MVALAMARKLVPCSTFAAHLLKHHHHHVHHHHHHHHHNNNYTVGLLANLVRIRAYATDKEGGPAAAASSANAEVDQQRSSAGGAASKARPKKWWKPDPLTGVWVPGGEDHDQEETTTSGVKASEVDHVDQDVTVRRRTIAPASLEERAWWSSMEEIPERHYN